MTTIIPIISIFAVVAAMFGLCAALIGIAIAVRASRRADALLDNVADLAVSIVQLEHMYARPQAVGGPDNEETTEERERKRREQEAQKKYLEGLNNVLQYTGSPQKEANK